MLATQLHAGVAVRDTSDLSSDPNVAALAEPFELAARSNVVYKHCQEFYVFTPEQIAFQKKAFERLSKQYTQAFYNAYVARIGVPPEKSVITNYTKYIYAQQVTAMNDTVTLINKRNSCEHGKIKKAFKFIEKMRYAEMQQNPETTTTQGSN